MTEAQQTAFESEILHAAFAAEKAVAAQRLRLSGIANELESLARAFREHPDEVNPLPDTQSMYDYRKEISTLRDGEKAIQMCAELRLLIQKSKNAEKRKGMWSARSFVPLDELV